MTNFKDAKPYIGTLSKTKSNIVPKINKNEAVREAIKIIRENQRLIEKAGMSPNENPHR